MTEKDLMMTSILNCRRVDLVTGAIELTEAQQDQFDRMMQRRAHGEPIQYILGDCDFMGLPLLVDEHVLIPRPETEILVELAIKRMKQYTSDEPISVLDLGTGSGNIAIALAKNIDQCSIHALDINEGSLALALKNSKVNGVDDKIKFLHRDMTAYCREMMTKNKKFDMIISNPPYIATGLLAHLPADVQREPSIALDGGVDGMEYYRAILKFGHAILSPKGCLFLELGDGQREAIEKLLRQYPNYGRVSFYKDYVGTDRIAAIEAA